MSNVPGTVIDTGMNSEGNGSSFSSQGACTLGQEPNMSARGKHTHVEGFSSSSLKSYTHFIMSMAYLWVRVHGF